jgi:hypothetical protein
VAREAGVNEFDGGVRQRALGLGDTLMGSVDEFVQCRLRTDEGETVARVTAGQRPGVGEKSGDAAPHGVFDHLSVDGAAAAGVVQIVGAAGTVVLAAPGAGGDAVVVPAAGRGDASAAEEVEAGRVLSLAWHAGGFQPFEECQLALWREDRWDPELDVLVFAVVGWDRCLGMAHLLSADVESRHADRPI